MPLTNEQLLDPDFDLEKAITGELVKAFKERMQPEWDKEDDTLIHGTGWAGPVPTGILSFRKESGK